jgi:uncharacterized tellurite resistance protein B-like protein
METEDKLAICRVVAQAILADGALTDAEHNVLTHLMDSYGLTEEQRHDVTRRNVEDDPVELVAGVAEEAKQELIAELARAVTADGDVAPAENRTIKAVASALGISSEQVDQAIARAGD